MSEENKLSDHLKAARDWLRNGSIDSCMAHLRMIIPLLEEQEIAAERLQRLLSEAVTLFDGAQSGYISGSGSDLRWTDRRNKFFEESRKALHPTQPAEGREKV